jgi:flagellar basal-body rod modification protein FlgD
MDIPGISANDPFSAPLGDSGAFASSTQELDRNAFMQLLVAQLENQDPLQPIADQDFIAQLATFSNLEQLEGLNRNVIAMIALNQSNALLSQLTQSSALIGKSVSWTDPETLEERSGTVESVKIQDGLAVLHIDGEDVPLAAVSEILETPPAPEPETP